MKKNQFKQKLELVQGQRLSPQQIQLMRLVEMNVLGLEKEINNELEDNPALDYIDKDETENHTEKQDEIPYYKYQQHLGEKNNYQHQTSWEKSFNENLKEQLSNFKLSKTQQFLCEILIGNIDNDGYIRRDLYDILDDITFSYNINFSITEIKEALNIIHKMEPTGIGATSLQECLILQLQHKPQNEYINIAINILKNHYNLFIKKHYDKIIEEKITSKQNLRNAITEIEKLNPKPANSISDSLKINNYITVDFIIKIENEKLVVTLNNTHIPKLNVSKSYYDILENTTEKNPNQNEAKKFIKQKINSAKFFINAIKQRQNTLLSTMLAILDKQQNYFLLGDENLLKPMTMQNIADKTHLDVSTISRVVNGKYADTPFGFVELRNLFTDSTTNDKGEEISTLQVKNALKEIVDKEDKEKPFSDENLVELLKEKGFVIARRTVAKYRQQLKISVARLRKKII